MPPKSKQPLPPPHTDLIVIALDKLCKISTESKDATSLILEYLRSRSCIELEYATQLEKASGRLLSALPPHLSALKDLVKAEIDVSSEKHRAFGDSLSKEIEFPFRGVVDEVNLRQNQAMMLVDEIVRLAPNFQIPPSDRPQAASYGERIMKTEQSRYDKIEFAAGLYRKAIDTLHGMEGQDAQMGLVQSFVDALAAMPVVRDSRWKPWIAEHHEVAVVEDLSGWDTDAFKSFPTLADNPSAAAAIEEMPEVASLNTLVDHIVAKDYNKPVFHQPTRDPVRNALFTSIKKEGEQQGLKWENIDFYYVIGGNQSAHVCMPVGTVQRIFNRMLNLLQFPQLAKSEAIKASTLSNYADIRLKKFKSQSDLTKTMTKADRATDNFRVGAEMLKMMSNLGQFDMLVSLDLEGWELGCHNITELGFSVYSPARKDLTAYHFIIEENMHLKNGNIMPNHRDQFIYGQSIVKPLKEAYRILCDTIRRGQNVAIVGHGIASDIQMILDAGLEKLPSEACTKIDTQTLFLQVNRCAENSRLENVLEHFKLPTAYLHNAGNDAFCTLLVCLRLAGEDVDIHVQGMRNII